MKLKKLGVAATFIVAATLAPQPIPAYADSIRNSQWHLRTENVAEAHRYSQGNGVTVAVLDTGVNARHPDLQGSVLKGADIVPGGSGDGQRDTDGHGTGMAGLIAAHGHGRTSGALGLAPEAKILPVRVETAANRGNSDEVTRGIDYAVQQGAQVISISWGVGGTPELRAAVDRALKADAVVVASAGNRPEDVFVTYPAAIEGVLAAAATDRNGNHASVSVTGKQVVLAAPGVDITSTSQTGGYRTGTGTSDSTAIIAGAVALVRAKYPDLSADEVVHRLTATAIDKGPAGRDEQYGFGVLNLVAALTADVPAAAGASATPTSGAPTSTTPPAAAAPTTEPSSSSGGNTAVVAIIVLLAFLAAGGVTWLVLARRNRAT